MGDIMDARELGKILYRSRESVGTYVTALGGVIDESVARYREGLSFEGYVLYSEKRLSQNSFYVYRRGGDALLLSYYPYLSEARVVEEKSSSLFDFRDGGGEDSVSASITQLDLKDFAMNYVIRLRDGRFIVIDIGSFDEDVDALYEVLRERSGGKDIIIAAWILTHPHIDHYHGVTPFLKKYGGRVTVEKLLYNFPACEEGDVELIPELGQAQDEFHKIPAFVSYVDSLGIPSYRPHTGFIYDIGGARIEILNSPDDNMSPPKAINDLSLVFTLTYCGQKIFFGGDYQFQSSPFTEVWGDYIKSDIMQAPHHGFHGGTKRLIELVDAATYLMPSFEDDTFLKICCKYDFNCLSWTRTRTEDYYTGSNGHVTLSLPHTPRADGRKRLDSLLRKYNFSEDNIIYRY